MNAKTCRGWLKVLLAVFAAAQLAACTTECDSCDSDDDCDDGQTCASYQDGESRCSYQSTESCPG